MFHHGGRFGSGGMGQVSQVRELSMNGQDEGTLSPNRRKLDESSSFLPASRAMLKLQVSDSLLVLWYEAFPQVAGGGSLQISQRQTEVVVGFIEIGLVFHVQTISGQQGIGL